MIAMTMADDTARCLQPARTVMMKGASTEAACCRPSRGPRSKQTPSSWSCSLCVCARTEALTPSHRAVCPRRWCVPTQLPNLCRVFTNTDGGCSILGTCVRVELRLERLESVSGATCTAHTRKPVAPLRQLPELPCSLAAYVHSGISRTLQPTKPFHPYLKPYPSPDPRKCASRSCRSRHRRERGAGVRSLEAPSTFS